MGAAADRPLHGRVGWSSSRSPSAPRRHCRRCYIQGTWGRGRAWLTLLAPRSPPISAVPVARRRECACTSQCPPSWSPALMGGTSATDAVAVGRRPRTAGARPSRRPTSSCGGGRGGRCGGRGCGQDGLSRFQAHGRQWACSERSCFPACNERCPPSRSVPPHPCCHAVAERPTHQQHRRGNLALDVQVARHRGLCVLCNCRLNSRRRHDRHSIVVVPRGTAAAAPLSLSPAAASASAATTASFVFSPAPGSASSLAASDKGRS